MRAHTFHPADFTIRSDGVCRLNPEMARQVVRLVAAEIQTKLHNQPNAMSTHREASGHGPFWAAI